MTKQPSEPSKGAARRTKAEASAAPAKPAKVERLYCGLLGKVVAECPTEGAENCSTC